MSEIRELDAKFNQSVQNLNTAWKKISDQLVKSQKENADLKEKFSDTQLILDQKDKDHKELEEKYKIAKAKVDRIESQLQENIDKMASISKAKRKDIDALQLLDIYLVLMEQVFESASHVRLLLMLHGDADEYNINDLGRASGIAALQIKQAMFELRNAGVVEYNEETQIVRLKQRFLG